MRLPDLEYAAGTGLLGAERGRPRNKPGPVPGARRVIPCGIYLC